VTTRAALELVIDDLQAAIDSARTFGFPERVIDRLKLMQRAAVHTRAEVVELQSSPRAKGEAAGG
jgi:hypothetical protein